MRADMKHVYNEKSRTSKRAKAYNEKSEKRITQQCWKNDGEGFNKYDSHKRILGRGDTGGGRRYNVLRKYLLAQVGKKWDDVYSDICNILKADDYTRNYIKMHVATDVVMKDGLPYSSKLARWRKTYEIYEDVYVNPDTGIICKTPKYPRPLRRKKSISYIKIENEVFYVLDKKSKIWYKCWIKQVPTYQSPVYLDRKDRKVFWFNTTKYEKVYDCFLRSYTDGALSARIYGLHRYYCYQKQQINKRQLVDLRKKLALVYQG